MRVAIIAPLFEPIPPRKYGGTERVIYNLVEELVKLGHNVTLYGVAGSSTSAKLVECDRKPIGIIGLDYTPDILEKPFSAQLKLALDNISKHDIIHVHHGTCVFHPDVMAKLTNNGNKSYPLLWTDHDLLTAEKPRLLQELGDLNIGFTALSDSHRNSVRNATNFLATIHHGLPVKLLTPKNVPQTYVAFLGRITKVKNPTAAVRIANGAGYRLKVAAPVHAVDVDYYENEVKPLFEASKVEYINSVDEVGKQELLSGAVALLFPIVWREPFGLVMIEAMACGCPVIAFRNGSVEEVIEDGVTGFIVENEEEAIKALKRVGELNRQQIRALFEEKFTATTMAKKYVEIYQQVIDVHRSRQRKEALNATIRSIANTSAYLDSQESISIIPQVLTQTKVKAT